MKTKKSTYKNNPSLVIADPFVYRWLGEYYLFGTGDFCPVYKSQDLIDWTYLGTAIEPDQENVDIKGCYAPEVVYFGGLFYIVYSPKGNEHRIYCSKNIANGYTPCDNIFGGIDASFFVEKQGVTIFRSAEVGGKAPDGIYYKTCPTIKDFDREGWQKIPAAYLNGWTEGPFLVERKGYKYLTYTGNHYLSEGYRIAYVSGQGENYEKYQGGDTLIISTEKKYNGLGHSATVIGPNLDSFIITYHNLAPDKSKRFYNFSTLITDGKKMFCNGLCNYPSALPLRADFECQNQDWLTKKDNGLFIPTEVNGVFTAELSFKKSEENFIYLGDYTLSLKNDLATLYNDKTTLNANFVPIIEDSCYVVRIVCDDILKVYINSQEIFSEQISIKGAIGYDTNTKPLYTALTLDAFGSSDKKLVKNIPSNFPANSCINEQECIFEDGVNYILPKNATYNLNVGFSGKYAIILNTKSLKGGKIGFTFNKKHYSCEVAEGKRRWLTIIVKLKKGANTLVLNSDDIYVCDLQFEAINKKKAKIKNQDKLLTVYEETKLAVERGELTYSHGKHKTFDGKVSFFVENTKNYCGGITIRENLFAHYIYHPTESFYGYLVAVFDSKLHFYKCQYSKELLCEFPIENGRISVEFNKNKFKFYNEDNLIGSYVDKTPYFYGNVGVYALKGLQLHKFKLAKIKEDN